MFVCDITVALVTNYGSNRQISGKDYPVKRNCPFPYLLATTVQVGMAEQRATTLDFWPKFVSIMGLGKKTHIWMVEHNELIHRDTEILNNFKCVLKSLSGGIIAGVYW